MTRSSSRRSAPAAGSSEVHRLVGGLTLTENRRQRNDAERAALEVWRTGDHEQALRILADTGRIHATESAIEAHEQILTTWDEVRGRWSDPHDLIESLTVLAAKNTDVDLLNLGAQQIRRQRGELGTEHRYALSGGAEVNLAVGDLVRVRQNDYRSRRGEGPDVLNGYRAVVTAIDENHRVEIAWRDTKTSETVSAWFDAQAISSGALSLGYCMTVAASQGLTSEVSLLYGHGSNAFATYPGITRGRAENHLWLPLGAIEDDETQARLGAARTETERLQRAVTAFAKFLGQDRGDYMVSDLLREPPAPVRVPAQAEHEHEVAREESEAALRRAHEATTVSPARAREAYEQAQRLAAHETTDAQDADEMAVSLEPATDDDARERAAREKRMADNQRRREMASVQSWKSRPFGKQSDAALARRIGLSYEAAGQAEGFAAKKAEEARVLEERLVQEKQSGQTRGQAFVAAAATVLDQAEAKAKQAAEEAGRAMNARAAAEQKDTHLREYLEPKRDLSFFERRRAVRHPEAAGGHHQRRVRRARGAADGGQPGRERGPRRPRGGVEAGARQQLRGTVSRPRRRPAFPEGARCRHRAVGHDARAAARRRDAPGPPRRPDAGPPARRGRQVQGGGRQQPGHRGGRAGRAGLAQDDRHELPRAPRRRDQGPPVAHRRAEARGRQRSQALAQESASYHRQQPSQGRGGPSMGR